MAKNNRVKYADIKAGMTVFKVYAFPHRGASAWVEVYRVTGRPAPGNIGREKKHHFVPYYDFNSITGCRVERSFSIGDANVIPNHYNFHRLFHTRKSAERYAQRIRTGCLTAAERKSMGRHERMWASTKSAVYLKRAA